MKRDPHHTPGTHSHHNVVDLFSHQHRKQQQQRRIVRLSPECDGMELLYANDHHPDTLFSLKILAWALQENGDITAMVPWLKALLPAPAIADPLNGRFEGYRYAGGDIIFTEPPEYKVAELHTALDVFGLPDVHSDTVHQDIPDTIGTHAAFSENGFVSVSLVEVVSWRLLANGTLQAMVAEPERVTRTPVLPGDDCLVAAQTLPHFRYFFQHNIANRIKERDPEALAALALLSERP